MTMEQTADFYWMEVELEPRARNPWIGSTSHAKCMHRAAISGPFARCGRSEAHGRQQLLDLVFTLRVAGDFDFHLKLF